MLDLVVRWSGVEPHRPAGIGTGWRLDPSAAVYRRRPRSHGQAHVARATWGLTQASLRPCPALPAPHTGPSPRGRQACHRKRNPKPRPGSAAAGGRGRRPREVPGHRESAPRWPRALPHHRQHRRPPTRPGRGPIRSGTRHRQYPSVYSDSSRGPTTTRRSGS